MEKNPSLVWNKIDPVGSVTEPTISKAIATFTTVLVSRKWLLGFGVLTAWGLTFGQKSVSAKGLKVDRGIRKCMVIK